MEEDILNYSPTFMFHGTPCTCLLGNEVYVNENKSNQASETCSKVMNNPQQSLKIKFNKNIDLVY